MNKRIILISTALIISNLGFAYDVQTIQSIEAPITQNIVYDIHRGVYSVLVSKGLDKEVAQELSHNVLGENAHTLNLMLNNVEKSSASIDIAHITDFIASRALQRKKVNLASYDTLIAIAQSQKGLHVEKTVLEELQAVAKKNQELLYTI